MSLGLCSNLLERGIRKGTGCCHYVMESFTYFGLETNGNWSAMFLPPGLGAVRSLTSDSGA